VKEYYKHVHSTMIEFKSSVEGGCPLCKFVWNTLASDDQVRLFAESLEDNASSPEIEVIDHYYTYGRAFSFKFPGRDDESRVRFDPIRGSGATRFLRNEVGYLYDLQMASNTGSKPSLALTRRWIKDCIDHHQLCNFEQDEIRKLPTRLIVTGLPGASSVRLCLSENLPDNTKYMTLSHCWGSSNFLTLTLENIENLMKSIEVSTLPKTFRDAIHFASTSEVEYLWIDSLCIIQNSVADWQHESGLMAAVYANA